MNQKRLSEKKIAILNFMVEVINKRNERIARVRSKRNLLSCDFEEFSLHIDIYGNHDAIEFCVDHYRASDGRVIFIDSRRLHEYKYCDLDEFGGIVRFIRAAYNFGMENMRFKQMDYTKRVRDHKNFIIEGI